MPVEKKYLVCPLGGKKFAQLSLLFLGLLNGCGYTLNHRLQESLRSPHGIFVPVFDNQTQEVGAEAVFTDAFIRELLSHGEKISQNKESGALEVKGTVTQIQRLVEVQSGAGLQGLQAYQRVPDQIGVRAYILIQLIEPKTQKVVWANEFNAYRRVSAPLNRMMDVDAPSSLGLITESLIENSYDLIARDLMRDVYDSMVEVF